jgi:hypothetical protein
MHIEPGFSPGKRGFAKFHETRWRHFDDRLVQRNPKEYSIFECLLLQEERKTGNARSRPPAPQLHKKSRLRVSRSSGAGQTQQSAGSSRQHEGKTSAHPRYPGFWGHRRRQDKRNPLHPPDRVKEFSFKASGGSWSKLFDGAEKVLSWDNILRIHRSVLLPQVIRGPRRPEGRRQGRSPGPTYCLRAYTNRALPAATAMYCRLLTM